MSRYIEVEKAMELCNAFHFADETCSVEWLFKNAPSIDIVRCKECKYFIDNLTENDADEAYDACRWDWERRIPKPDDFCSYGERKESE